MKILVVQDWLRSGGTERQSVFLANAFSAAGHDTTLLTYRPGGRLAATVASGVRRVVLQPFDTRLDWLSPGLNRAVLGLAPEVVLCMGRMANCDAGTLQRTLNRSPGKPGHASAGARPSVVSTMRTGKPLPWLFRRSLRSVQHVVANSVDAKHTLVTEHGVPAERISVIYNSLVFPAEPRVRVEPRTTIRAQHGATRRTSVLLCVAMFRPEKNQRELIEIVADLPENSDCQLWLAGDGPSRAACERIVAARGLGERIKFLGFQGNPAPLYAAADIAVHASRSESLSNFLIEAQAHGLPAVAYEAQGIKECFIPGQTGWAVAAHDRCGFRARLNALMDEDEAVRATRATQARVFARTTFDPVRQVEAYLELFARLQRGAHFHPAAADLLLPPTPAP